MSEYGVFAVDRGIFNHPVFNEHRAFSRLEAWLWLLAEAAWKERRRDLVGQTVTIKRGQLAHSVRFMADAWGWSKSAVQRFLDRLKTDTMIGTASGTGILVITICNYDAFQRVSLPSGTAIGTASGTGPGQDRDKLEDIQDIQVTPPTPKRGRRAADDRFDDKADPLVIDFLAAVWSNRWARKGHNPRLAFRAFLSLKITEREACKAAIAGCARAIERDNPGAQRERFRPMLASWIRARGWEGDGAADKAAGPDWSKWIVAFKRDGHWNPQTLGPRPGEPGCRVPPEMLIGVAA